NSLRFVRRPAHGSDGRQACCRGPGAGYENLHFNSQKRRSSLAACL
ncbi:DNA-directed RNA polymerase II RPBABC8, partial [Toxoplasma gondii FOU]